MSHRNEPARSRRRQVLREQLSLRSIPLVEPAAEKYNLDNHFGWNVLQKCKIGDGSFPPYLLHCVYCDKPSVPPSDDGDRDKVMYVLYIRGKDGEIEPVDFKETQTTFSALKPVRLDLDSHTEPKEKARMVITGHPPRRRLIGDFYYIPIKERTIEKYDIRPASQVHPGDYSRSESEGEVLDTSKTKHKGKKGARGRTKPKGWQLRAGAESPNDNEGEGDACDSDMSSEAETEQEEPETPRTLVDNVKKFTRMPTIDDCSSCFGKSQNEPELKNSPLERNRYLYLPRDRYEKRPISDCLPTVAEPRPPSPTENSNNNDQDIVRG